MNNPHLIKGYKYDIRFHGLITSIKPLKLYLYNEGFIKISTEKYDYNNFDNKFSFITNMALNKKNKKKYIYPKNMKNIEDSNIWNLSMLKKYFVRKGLDYNKLYEKVKDIFIKMIFSVRQKLINYIIKYNLNSSNFYHLIGFDILLDDNLKPYLLEANRRCGARDDNDAEKIFTFKMIVDTINLIGLRTISIKNKKLNYKDELNEYIKDNLCELDRPRGGYNLIFPLKNNIEKYKKFYLDDIPVEDLNLWNNLIKS